MEIAELKKQLEELEREITILEWDKKRNQLNAGKEVYLKRIVEARDEIIEKLQPEEEVLIK